MQVVAADVGNSSIKFLLGTYSADSGKQNQHSVSPAWSVCRSIQLTCNQEKGTTDFSELNDIQLPCHWFASSVNEHNSQLLRDQCDSLGIVRSWHELERQALPITIDLDSPDTVGIDRLLAAIAAAGRYGDNKHDVIVIDCGTAMTIDLVSSDNIFRGGVIMAGPATILQALNHRTSALPDLSQEKLQRPSNVLGRSTRQAMLSGAWHSGLGAIQQVVREIAQQTSGDPIVVGTGGGLGPWQDALPDNWITVDDLVLDGIFHVACTMINESSDEF